MLITALLIMTTFVHAGQTAASSSSSPKTKLPENPGLIIPLNLSRISASYESICTASDKAPALVKPLFSLITNVTNQCLHPVDPTIDRLAILDKQTQKYASALNTDSQVPVEDDLKAHAFSVLAQAYRPHDMAAACIYACKALNVYFPTQKAILLDPALVQMLAHALQFNDELRAIIYATLPPESRYVIGRALVRAKPTAEQMITHAITHKQPYTPIDRALLSWQKSFYKSKLPAAIAPTLFDDVIASCSARDLSQFIQPIVASQYVHSKENPVQCGQLAFQLYNIDSENTNHLAAAVRKGHHEAYEVAYERCRELWVTDPVNANNLFLALAAQGHPAVCNRICTELESFGRDSKTLAADALSNAMQSDNEQVKRFVLTYFTYIVETYPTLCEWNSVKISPAKAFLQKVANSTDSELSLQAQLILCVADATTSEAIKNLKAFIANTTSKHSTPHSVHYEAHRQLARLYETYAEALANQQARATNQRVEKNKAILHASYVRRAEESRAIAMESQNPFTRFKAQLEVVSKKIERTLEQRETGRNALAEKQLAASKKELLQLVEHLRQTPIPQEHTIFNQNDLQPTQTNIIVDILTYLAFIEEIGGNHAEQQNFIAQAFALAPSSQTVHGQIKRVVESQGTMRTRQAYTETTQFLETLQNIHPDCPIIYMNQACIERGEKNSTQALQLYIKAAELGLPSAWIKAAALAESLKMLPDAKKYYENGINAAPTNMQYKEFLASFAYTHSYFCEAEQLLQQTHKTDHLAAFRLGLLYLHGNAGTYDPGKAKDLFKHALILAQKDSVPNKQLEKKYEYYILCAQAQVHEIPSTTDFQELAAALHGNALVQTEIKVENCIALAKQHQILAKKLKDNTPDASGAAPSQPTSPANHMRMTQLYLAKAEKLSTAFSPRIKLLQAQLDAPAALDQVSAEQIEQLRSAYAEIIEHGHPQNYFVEFARKEHAKLDQVAQAFNPAEKPTETN